MFTSDEPKMTRAYPPGPDRSDEPASLVDPWFVALEIWKARFWIAALAILGAGLAVFIALATPKVYHASTQLILDPRGLNLVQNEVTQTPLGLASDAALALIQSQIAVITSTSVLERVVDEAGLTQDPEFNGTAEGPFDRYIPSIAFLSGDPEDEIEDRRLVTLVNLRRAVSASRNANSFVIDVTVESESPQKAAELANRVAATFIDEQGRVQAETARRATADLTARLVELRQRVGEAEEAVERYKAENRLVGVGGRLIDDEFILRINNQLATVRGEITSLNVRAESMRQTSVDDVVEGTFPEALSSQSLVRLRQTYADADQQNAILSARLGPRHPQRIASEEALRTARRAIATELSRIVAAAQTELSRARETERDLTAQIEELRGRQIETSESFVGLRELERDVDASRAIYEAYLLRSREIGEQESLNTANVRTISPATMPFQPSGMSRKVIVAAGGILGLGFGFGLALLLALSRLIKARMSAAPMVPAAAVPAAGFDRPVWTALPPPNERDRTNEHETGTLFEADTEDDDPSTGAVPDRAADEGYAEPREEPEASAEPIIVSPRGEASMAADEGAVPEAGEEPEVSSDADPSPDGDAQENATSAENGLARPAAPSESEPESDRRERLRQRIRDIGTRRRIGAPPLDDAHVSEAIRRLARSERPTIAELRRRRRQNESDPT